MDKNIQNEVTLEGPRHKTGFSGFSFRRTIGDKYSNEQTEVQRVKYGEIKDEITDGAVLSHIVLDDSKAVPVMFNRYNFKKILRFHGYFNAADIVVTANEFEEGLFIKGEDGKRDKINLIKNTDKGCFVIGANKINGFGVVTFFEQYNSKQKQRYLASMRKRGMSFRSLEGGEASPIDSIRYRRNRLPAHQSGVRADGESIR